MTIYAALQAHLAGTSGITDLVDTRIYPLQAKQGAALPYLTFQRISEGPQHVLGGLPSLSQDRWQFSAWAGSQIEAMRLANAVKTALRGFTGTMGGAGGVDVSCCIDVFSTELFDGDSKTFHMPVDFMISHDAV